MGKHHESHKVVRFQSCRNAHLRPGVCYTNPKDNPGLRTTYEMTESFHKVLFFLSRRLLLEGLDEIQHYCQV